MKAPVLVVCAVAAELAAFAHRDADVLAVGIGPVESAVGTARALAARRYAAVINAGIAGGFRGRAAVGEAVAIEEACYAELGLEDGGALTLPAGTALVERSRSDARLLAPYRAGVLTAAIGRGVTSASVTTTDARADELAARFAPHTEAMEGFAVLRAAAAAEVPALELRGISNLVGDRARGQWDFRAGSQAVTAALEALFAVVERYV